METPEVQQQNDGVSKKFDANMGKLIALMKGDAVFKPVKIQNNDASDLIDELIKEKTESIKAEFKQKASGIITAKVEFDKFIKEKEKEFQNAVNNKKKEFNKQLEELFALLESIDEIKKTYAESLG